MPFSVDVVIRLPGLDKKYELQCDCGYRRDYGYMWQTAESEYIRHMQRYPNHVTDLIIFDAPALSDRMIKHRLAVAKKSQGRNVKTLKVEPGLV